MSIYDSIGGAAAVRAAVDDFYARVLADRRLAPFFARTDLERDWNQPGTRSQRSVRRLTGLHH